MLQEPLLEWSEPFLHYVEFLAVLLPVGAVGFRYSALRGPAPGGGEQVWRDAARRAAWIGVAGMAAAAFMLARGLPALAERRHTTVTALMTGSLQPALQVILFLVALAGFLLAAAGRRPGWVLAALGAILGQVRGVLGGQLVRLVNPLHVLFASLWIGSLFRDEPTAEGRGALAARMVNGFSPLALVSAACVAIFGVITAWRHLHRLDALWTTPYGLALIAKLAAVAVVVALGAWNWRRQRPALGSDTSARSLRRTATSELAAAGVVLLITGVLVSLPSPRRPGAPPVGAGAAAPAPVEAPH